MRNNIEVQLEEDEVRFLKEFVTKGIRKAREVYRANTLLLANKGMNNKQIAEVLSIDSQTVYRIKKRYKDRGLESALNDKPRSGQPPKYKERETAEIIALACSSPPKGRKRWTIELLTEESHKIKGLEKINRESVRLILKKQKLSPG
jgi:transposase